MKTSKLFSVVAALSLSAMAGVASAESLADRRAESVQDVPTPNAHYSGNYRFEQGKRIPVAKSADDKKVVDGQYTGTVKYIRGEVVEES
ncbi:MULTISPECIES: hypothetical protein [unclassified Hahella]|uniref:hypothetical protein n=1 Tax=unclassified Hahella TaxID=2624107 RepID=UPI001C1EF8F3|nr:MULTISPECIES: hypothetical protein [unclassified Hahella]MBU6952320.1 hypothetical protein [Hahella sp. HN01]MDG9668607.1 hypothetical protein [Hahella sp. CR1]